MIFLIQMPVNISASVQEAKNLVKRNGGSFTGDTRTGTFSVMGVTGMYHQVVGAIRISITKRPWFVSENLIRKKISGYFR
jgi:hypothetical protein